MTTILRQIREELGEGLASELRRLPVKETSQALGCAPRAVKNWRQSEALPSAEYLILMGRKFPMVRALVKRLMEEREDASFGQTQTLIELRQAIDKALSGR